MMRVYCLIMLCMTALGVGCSLAAAPPAVNCSTVVPAEMRGPQPRWLGQCADGKAVGVGVLRVGARAPFAFFFGRVVAGRPQTGLIMLSSGNMMEIRGVTASGAVLPTDGENIPEQDRAWDDAAAGARLVARRFAAARNPGSSAYYARWAHKIETQRPE
jgi:hypothetical protein